MAGEWVSIRLGPACTRIGSGATPRGGGSVYLTAGEVALVRSQNVYNDGFHHEGLVYLSDAHAKELKNVTVEPEDVLLNITGDSVARCCQVDPDVLPARVNQHVAIIRPKPHVLDPQYLRYYLVSPTMQSRMLSWAGAGGTRNALTKGMIETFDIPAPKDVGEQRAIGTLLGTLDDRIETNRKHSRVLEGIARAVFTSWFVDFDPVHRPPRAIAKDTVPPLSKDLAALFPTRLVDSPIGEVPEGWRVGTIDSLCDSINSGGTPARMNKDYWEGGTIPWFKTGELFDAPLFDSEEYITEAAVANSSCRLWPPGTILFAMYASPTVGRMGVLTRPGTSNQAAAGLIVKPEYGVPFLLNALFFARAKLQQIAVGAAQQNINQGVLKAHQVVVPSAGLALKFSQMMTPALEKQAQLSSQSATLSALRDALLPKLISGELRIADAEKITGRDV